MFGLKVLLAFLGTVKLDFAQEVADLIAYHTAGIGIAVDAQGATGIGKRFLEPTAVQSADLPVHAGFQLHEHLGGTLVIEEGGPSSGFLVIVRRKADGGGGAGRGIGLALDHTQGHGQVVEEGRVNVSIGIMARDLEVVFAQRQGLFVSLTIHLPTLVSPSNVEDGGARTCEVGDLGLASHVQLRLHLDYQITNERIAILDTAFHDLVHGHHPLDGTHFGRIGSPIGRGVFLFVGDQSTLEPHFRRRWELFQDVALDGFQGGQGDAGQSHFPRFVFEAQPFGQTDFEGGIGIGKFLATSITGQCHVNTHGAGIQPSYLLGQPFQRTKT